MCTCAHIFLRSDHKLTSIVRIVHFLFWIIMFSRKASVFLISSGLVCFFPGLISLLWESIVELVCVSQAYTYMRGGRYNTIARPMKPVCLSAKKSPWLTKRKDTALVFSLSLGNGGLPPTPFSLFLHSSPPLLLQSWSCLPVSPLLVNSYWLLGSLYP